jgi:ankyrin repeat protein
VCTYKYCRSFVNYFPINLFFSVLVSSVLISFNASPQGIFDACRNGDTSAIKAMIKVNPDTVNCRNEGGFTPLIIAGYRGQMEVVKLLLKHKADINAKSGEGTVLMGACFKGNVELAALLIKYKADVNSVNDLETTPLMYAILSQKVELIKLLLENGALKDVKERSGKTALDYAIQSGNKEIIKLVE